MNINEIKTKRLSIFELGLLNILENADIELTESSTHIIKNDIRIFRYYSDALLLVCDRSLLLGKYYEYSDDVISNLFKEKYGFVINSIIHI